MRQRSLILLIVALGVGLNAIAYALYRGLRARPEATWAAPADAGGPSSEQRDADERGRARRSEGLAALEAGEYDRAEARFSEAQALMGERANVADLLRITQDLQAKAAASKAAAAAPAKASAEVESPQAKLALSHPAPARPAPRMAAFRSPAPGPSDAAPSQGVLLISTTPRGLLVQLDGAALDLTPVRVSVKPGAHKVSLYDGERRLLETTVQVGEGEVATLRRDLSAELALSAAQKPAAAPPAGAPRPTAPPPAIGIAPPNPAAAPVALQKASPEPASAQALAALAQPERGGLDVTSPGLYAEVWINGRSYGFPPVAARNLPAGTAEVEVRVNGAVKRRAKVVVQPGQVFALKVR